MSRSLQLARRQAGNGRKHTTTTPPAFKKQSLQKCHPIQSVKRFQLAPGYQHERPLKGRSRAGQQARLHPQVLQHQPPHHRGTTVV